MTVKKTRRDSLPVTPELSSTKVRAAINTIAHHLSETQYKSVIIHADGDAWFCRDNIIAHHEQLGAFMVTLINALEIADTNAADTREAIALARKSAAMPTRGDLVGLVDHSGTLLRNKS